MIPTRIFFTQGHGYHDKELGSFELALRDAGIQSQNLVYVSSIFPPQCDIIKRDRGLELLRPGEITFCVMARQGTNEANRLASAAIGVAVPKERVRYGYLSEVHGFGKEEAVIGEEAEDLAMEFLAATLKLEFDWEKSWNEQKEEWKLDDSAIYTTKSYPMVKPGIDGKYLTVISVALLLP